MSSKYTDEQKDAVRLEHRRSDSEWPEMVLDAREELEQLKAQLRAYTYIFNERRFQAACAAMQGLLAAKHVETPLDASVRALAYADALLAALATK